MHASDDNQVCAVALKAVKKDDAAGLANRGVVR